MDDQAKLAEIKLNGRLPSPKGAASKVLQLCQNEDATNLEIAHAIQADPRYPQD